MTYTKNTWAPGDIITSEATAEKLNNLEDAVSTGGGGGGSAGSLWVEMSISGDVYSLSETWQTIWDAVKAGKAVIVSNYIDYTTMGADEGGVYIFHQFGGIAYATQGSTTTYTVRIDLNSIGTAEFEAPSANDYPSFRSPE